MDAGNGWVPCGQAVVGGYDVNGENIYIGRVFQEGEIIPGMTSFTQSSMHA